MKPARFWIIPLLALGLAGCVTSGARLPIAPSPQPSTQQPDRLASLKGGVVSQLAGLELTKAQTAQALVAEYNALEKVDPNQPLKWQDTAQGIDGEVIPFQPYRVGSQDCRAYTHTIQQAGKSVTGRGTACRNEDGAWEFLL